LGTPFVPGSGKEACCIRHKRINRKKRGYIWGKEDEVLAYIGVFPTKRKNWNKYKILLDKLDYSLYHLSLSGKKWGKVVRKLERGG
jgi:hypothetical protein